MELENQVCSLEYAKKLKELGVKQNSLFYWVYAYTPEKGESSVTYSLSETISFQLCEHISSFTVAELGEMLPENMTLTERGRKNYWIKSKGNLPHFEAETEANARAKMLIYLLENKLI